MTKETKFNILEEQNHFELWEIQGNTGSRDQESTEEMITSKRNYPTDVVLLTGGKSFLQIWQYDNIII